AYNSRTWVAQSAYRRFGVRTGEEKGSRGEGVRLLPPAALDVSAPAGEHRRILPPHTLARDVRGRCNECSQAVVDLVPLVRRYTGEQMTERERVAAAGLGQHAFQRRRAAFFEVEPLQGAAERGRRIVEDRRSGTGARPGLAVSAGGHDRLAAFELEGDRAT